jgi:hypothetical protein
MRPATVITLALLLLALFAAVIYQILRLPATDSAETTVAAARAVVRVVGQVVVRAASFKSGLV